MFAYVVSLFPMKTFYDFMEQQRKNRGPVIFSFYDPGRREAFPVVLSKGAVHGEDPFRVHQVLFPSTGGSVGLHPCASASGFAHRWPFRRSRAGMVWHCPDKSVTCNLFCRPTSSDRHLAVTFQRPSCPPRPGALVMPGPDQPRYAPVMPGSTGPLVPQSVLS